MDNRRSFLAALLSLPAVIVGRATRLPSAVTESDTSESIPVPMQLEQLRGVVARVRAKSEPLCVMVGRRGPEEMLAAREVVTFEGGWRRVYLWNGYVESYSPTAYFSIEPLHVHPLSPRHLGV